jgi:hypothetical protein
MTNPGIERTQLRRRRRSRPKCWRRKGKRHWRKRSSTINPAISGVPTRLNNGGRFIGGMKAYNKLIDRLNAIAAGD